MSVAFTSALAEYKALVWPEVRDSLKKVSDFYGRKKIPERYLKDLAFHSKLVSDYPRRRGKYLRPSLVLMAGLAMGASEEKLVKTASAMQISEEWMLMHDDFEDDSLERRGKPALHRIYGPELAVNAGDALHAIMWQVLRENEKILGIKKTLEVIDEFSSILMRTTFGQTTEINWAKENRFNLSDEDYFFIVDGKTVYYTIAGPMRLGAIIAGATKEQLKAIYEFAQPLGRCFQIRDDLLDLTSDFSGLKKQKGNDIYEGKRTLMLNHLLRTAKGKDRKELLEIVKKPRSGKTAGEVVWVIKTMEKYGSLDYAEKIGAKFITEAKEVFNKRLRFLAKEPARSQILAGIDFIWARDH